MNAGNVKGQENKYVSNSSQKRIKSLVNNEFIKKDRLLPVLSGLKEYSPISKPFVM
jgi:hypothetical protein